MSQNNPPEPLSVQDLFESGNYIIPVYQRNYAWGEKEIIQLIDDIYDYCKYENNDKKNYYIGTLVVFKRGEVFEVIDGQQRLTTLFILMSVLETLNDKFCLKFESREKAQKTLQEIRAKDFELKKDSKPELNTHILNAYEIIESRLEKFSDEKNSFVSYLLNNVQILRVEVPQDTDLNHYFEIMNNRGEQLEKHEILKSRMLGKLKDDNEATIMFNTIWEACANMEKYVQYGFNTYEGTKEKKIVSQRTSIFGANWNEFKTSCEDLFPQIEVQSNKSSEAENIENIINCSPSISSPDTNKSDIDSPERFNSVINFPNFLLHVLKIQESKKGSFDDKTVPLDDKNLLETFKDKYETAEDVKNFAFNLLKAKFLFDNYIIKREYTNTSKGDEWSLKQLIKNDHESKNNTAYYKNRFDKSTNDITNEETEEQKNEKVKSKKILMLLSMFHVSAPTPTYKHWLNASLKFLFDSTKPISADDYITYLENLAKAYMRDRFLAKEPKGYHEIIYPRIEENKSNELNFNNLNKGTNVENFIFNYLDYLLWKDTSIKEEFKKDFQFTFKSSVEHVYPQHPKDGQKRLQDENGKIDYLNSFGNLCLISASKNSALSNYQPIAKKDHYHMTGYDSIKQQLIMLNADNWWIDAIEEHQGKMMRVLSLNLEHI